MLQIKFTQCQSFLKIDMIISYILEWVLSSNVKLEYQDIGNIYIVDVRHDSWLLANFSSSHWWYSEYHPSVRQSVWFTNWVSYENNHTNSKSIVSVLYKPCQPHFPYLQILEICTFPFSSATIPLNWNYFFRLCRAEPLVSMFLELFKCPSSSLNSKSYLDTFCNGAYLEHFPCKSVRRWFLLYRPLSNYISSDIYYLAFPNDPLRIKLLVFAVYTAELLQAILLARMAYTEFAAGFGNFEAINEIGLLSLAVPILSSIGMCYSFWPCQCDSPFAYK